ncbi:MAG: nucleotidyltransferase family protein [Rubrivivax sp.]
MNLKAWDDLLVAARSANLAGRVADVVMQRGGLPSVPAPVRPHILTATRLSLHQREAIARECRELEAALAPLRVPVLLLKGAAYVMSGRQAAHGRLFGDIDILVPRVSLNEAEAALMRRGWSVGPMDPYDIRYYRRWMHELPPMTHRERGTALDVHHHILPLTARWTTDVEALLARREPVPGSIFSTLAPEDLVVHSAVHLFHEGQLRNGLRDLCDLDALLREFGEGRPGFAASVVSRSVELGLAWPVDLALHLCVELLLTPVDAATLDEVRRRSGLGRAHRALLSWAYRRALLPAYPPQHAPAVALARALLYLRAHALRMPPHRLAWHLARKAVLRTVKHSSRAGPMA